MPCSSYTSQRCVFYVFLLVFTIIFLAGRIDGTSGTSTNRRYAVAALVTFSCNEGHTLEGEASIVCTETGLWSHSPPYCK